ncbi:putative RNase H [Lyophyllum shimeji]|uniref:Ribonuclease H n=1 Tax=Lyophyllum shimeji TaxID=47721 RepID=A0A9P3PX02_LYOSH|nr:putative RNase H [Lyophyllum shimeji]
MPRAAKGPKFYAVKDGRETGVFLKWEDCEAQVKGYPGAKYKSFSNAADAEAFISGTLSTAPASSTQAATSTISENPEYKGKKRAMRENMEDESGWDVVYCDGSCRGNGKVGCYAGVGVWWGENDPRNIAERCPGDQTNNRAELIAIARVLETTPKSKKSLLIKTDSQYSINCFEKWLPSWISKGYKTSSGDPVKNLGIIKYVDALFKERRLFGQTVQLQYVKGHSGDRGNDGADAQANLGALMSPVPERDWATAEQEVLERAEEAHRRSNEKPPMKPLQVASDDLPAPAEPLTKMRKVSHELPFSKTPAPVSLPKTTRPTSSSKSMHAATPTKAAPSPRRPTSPSRPSRVAAVPPSSTLNKPTNLPSISAVAPSVLASNSVDVLEVSLPGITADSVPASASRSATPLKPRSICEQRTFDTPSRKHEAGHLTNSPSRSKSPRVVKEFAPLPSASVRARSLGLYPSTPKAEEKTQPPPPAKPTAMSVNEEDVDFKDYADCLGADDDLLDEL